MPSPRMMLALGCRGFYFFSENSNFAEPSVEFKEPSVYFALSSHPVVMALSFASSTLAFNIAPSAVFAPSRLAAVRMQVRRLIPAKPHPAHPRARGARP